MELIKQSVTLRLHNNVVHGKKTCVITDRVIYTGPLFKIFNTTSVVGFCISKQMPHSLSFGMDISQLVLWLYHMNIS